MLSRTMFHRDSLQTQLASVFEKLVTAAVSEISRLIDYEHERLSLEIYRCQKENDEFRKENTELKRRLTVNKKDIWGKGHNKHARWISSSDGYMCSESSSTKHEQNFTSPVVEKVFGKEWCNGLWEDDNVTECSPLSHSQPLAQLSPPEMRPVSAKCHYNQAVPGNEKVPVDESKDSSVLSLVKEKEQKHKVDYGNGDAQSACTEGDLLPSCSEQRDNQQCGSVKDCTGETADKNVTSVFDKDMEHYTSITSQETDAAEKRRFSCAYCEKSFCTLATLTIHNRVHTGERPYQCPHCEKNFAWPSAFKVHMKTHTGEKPFKCSKCGKCFAVKYNYKIHQRQHTGERPFNCTQCGKNYTTQHNLTLHHKKHHLTEQMTKRRSLALRGIAPKAHLISTARFADLSALKKEELHETV